MKKISISIFFIINILILTCSNPTSSDEIPPSVRITYPINKSIVSEIVNITCIATDNKSIKKVELWINGKSTEIIDNKEPYSLAWNTTIYNDATYTITVRAYDSSNNKTDSEPILLIVDNSKSNPQKINIISIEYNLNVMNILWNQSPDKDFDYYELFHSESIHGIKNLLMKNNNKLDTIYVLTEFDPTKESWYWISVTDSFGYSTPSDGYKILDDPPVEPIISPINYNNNSFVITWSRNDNIDFKTYNLYESLKSDMNDKELIFTSNDRENNLFIVSNVEYNELRYYQIITFDYWDLQTSSKIVSASSYPNIAFSNGGISIMDYDGSNAKTFYSSSTLSDFQFSPDGLKISYTKYNSSQTDIWLVNIDGSSNVALTNNQHQNFGQRFSPDGKKLVFVSNRNSNSEIYLMNIDGSNQTNLTNNPHDDYLPLFSPDGSKIIFTSNRDGNYELYIMDINGTNQINLTNNPFDDGICGSVTTAHGINGISQFSPDDSKIIFTSNRDNNYEIYIMNKDGSDQINLTNSDGTNFIPTFSPDGDQIFFLSNRNGNFSLYSMYIYGDDLTNLTPDLPDISFYDLSSDGSTIVLSSGNWIYTMNSDGTNLTNTNVWSTYPRLQPIN